MHQSVVDNTAFYILWSSYSAAPQLLIVIAEDFTYINASYHQWSVCICLFWSKYVCAQCTDWKSGVGQIKAAL